MILYIFLYVQGFFVPNFYNGFAFAMKSQNQSLTIQYFLTQLRSDFKGDIDFSEAGRHVYSTDNSIYQLKPQAVVYPKNTQDIQLLMRLIQQEDFHEIVLTARGGGTGTNGQSLTNGIVVDLSRHMNRILTIDPIKQVAYVQAGVVKDQLNAVLKPYGLFFAPELSTSNRATIGGMINTDASGQGSCRYGKTHHHVIALKTVILDGEILETSALARQNWESQVAHKSVLQREIYQSIFNLLAENQSLIQNSFPELNRSLTGYDLPHVLNDDEFNLNNILCGSEGTLGFIVEAELNLLKIPAHRMLINIGYAAFQDALNDAKALMTLKPLSIETVDSKVLGLAKTDMVWNNVARYFPELETGHTIQGINLVEIDAHTEQQLIQLKDQFLAHLEADQSVQRLTITTAKGATAIHHLYAMRKRAVGLLGNVQGEKRPQPFVEDTAVPPEHLAEYIKEFRALLDEEGLDYGMFGHVDAGVLHVRPLMDMKDPKSLEQMKKITDQVVKLTHKYKGVLWGEHGKGLRSEYAPIFFGQSYPLLQQVKALFDSKNQLNPGKIATPAQHKTAKLISVTEVPLRGDSDRQIPENIWNNYGATMHCNGNGACFNYDLNDPMCPSYKITRDRIHSLKGRATLIKEWLRREQNSEQSVSFDHQVYDALHGCLSCKSCSGQCPVKVDIPEAKAKFLNRYHQRYKRNIRDHLMSRLEILIPKILPISALYNFLQKLPPLLYIQRKVFKLVDIPLFHPQAKMNLEKYGAILLQADFNHLTQAPKKSVIIVQDAFTRYFDTPVLIETISLLKKLGLTPYILPFMPNGKPLHVHGFLDEFQQIKQRNIQILNHAARTGIAMIGIDPAMTLVFRQEYAHQQGEQLNDQIYQILMLQEWLHEFIQAQPLVQKTPVHIKYFLASHCTERTQSPVSIHQWKDIFKIFGLELEELALGCCGMAGTYGHEAEHRDLSKGIYQQSWQHHVNEKQHQVLVTGYSCRTQVKRFEQKTLLHPIQVLNQMIDRS